MYAEILNWKSIPVNLIEFDINNIIQLEDCSPHPTYDKFRQYRIANKELLDYIQQYFKFKIKHAYYQVIRDGLLTHIDIARSEVFNYLLYTGGPNVETIWYADDKTTELFKISLPVKKWHRLNVSSYHNVKGIIDTRVAISIFNLD